MKHRRIKADKNECLELIREIQKEAKEILEKSDKDDIPIVIERNK